MSDLVEPAEDFVVIMTLFFIFTIHLSFLIGGGYFDPSAIHDMNVLEIIWYFIKGSFNMWTDLYEGLPTGDGIKTKI